jgi:hypothetical protein
VSNLPLQLSVNINICFAIFVGIASLEAKVGIG